MISSGLAGAKGAKGARRTSERRARERERRGEPKPEGWRSCLAALCRLADVILCYYVTVTGLRPKVTTGRRCWSPSVWRGAYEGGKGAYVVRFRRSGAAIADCAFHSMRRMRVSVWLCSDLLPCSSTRFSATDRCNRAALEMLPWHRAEQSNQPRPRVTNRSRTHLVSCP